MGLRFQPRVSLFTPKPNPVRSEAGATVAYAPKHNPVKSEAGATVASVFGGSSSCGSSSSGVIA